MSEDLRQLRVGKTLHTREAQGDCEDFSGGHINTAKGIMNLKEDLQAASATKMSLGDVFPSKLFGTLDSNFQSR
jgi:hypothetical protein